MRHSQNRALAFSMERRLGQARFVGRNAANRDFRETPLPALPTNKQRQRNRQVLHINGFGVFHQFLRRAGISMRAVPRPARFTMTDEPLRAGTVSGLPSLPVKLTVNEIGALVMFVK